MYRLINFSHGPWLFERFFSLEILRSEVVVMDVGVRPYSSKKSLQCLPFVGPLSHTHIHMDPTLTFFHIVNSLSSSSLVGGISIGA
jgi:hypothetical protein